MKFATLNNIPVTLDNFKVCLSSCAPETYGKLMMTNVDILNCQVGQPLRKPRVDVKLVVRCVGHESQNSLCEHECRPGRPRLRHVGTDILHWKRRLIAPERGVKFRQLIQLKVARCPTDIVCRLLLVKKETTKL